MLCHLFLEFVPSTLVAGANILIRNSSSEPSFFFLIFLSLMNNLTTSVVELKYLTRCAHRSRLIQATFHGTEFTHFGDLNG